MRIVSWNGYGAPQGTLEELARQLPKETVDLCVLQETHATDDSWYDPLRRIAGYGLIPAVAENVVRKLPTGATLSPPEGSIRGYAIVWNKQTIAPQAQPYLVDYTTDAYWGPKTPCSAFDAGSKGYNQRPPLMVPVAYRGAPVAVFTWHAPLDKWNVTGLDMFSKSGALANAGKQTVIAGDFNSTSIGGYFKGFTGLQQKNSKIDYILANTAIEKVNEIPGLNVYYGSHWAVAAEVNW